MAFPKAKSIPKSRLNSSNLKVRRKSPINAVRALKIIFLPGNFLSYKDIINGVNITVVCTMKAVFELPVYCSASIQKALLRIEKLLVIILGRIIFWFICFIDVLNIRAIEIKPPKEQRNKMEKRGRYDNSILYHTYDDPHNTAFMNNKKDALFFFTKPINFTS